MKPGSAPEVRHLVLDGFDRPSPFMEGQSVGVVVPGVPRPGGAERVRYYSLGTDGILTLTTRHDNGRDAATSRWQKVS